MTVPTTKAQRRAILEANVWGELTKGSDSQTYSRSGPGPICRHDDAWSLDRRGWLTDTGSSWEITAEGIAAAQDLIEGRIASF